MIDETLFEAEEKMEKAVTVAKEDFATIRTGRATPPMFNKILVDYYGAPTPMNQLASFQTPEARMILISPFDKCSMRNIEKAIRDSDLGVNPVDDGHVIRVVLPEADRGAPQGVHQGRHGTRPRTSRVSIRNIRRHAKDHLEKLGKDGDAGEDDVRRAEKALEDLTAQARRAGRRAAQAQGSRAARGLRGRCAHERIDRRTIAGGSSGDPSEPPSRPRRCQPTPAGAPSGEPEEKKSRAGRNLPAAIAVGVILVAIALASLYFQLWLFVVRHRRGRSARHRRAGHGAGHARDPAVSAPRCCSAAVRHARARRTGWTRTDAVHGVRPAVPGHPGAGGCSSAARTSFVRDATASGFVLVLRPADGRRSRR